MRFSVNGRFFYLHSPFLEEEDEFAEYYHVFRLVNFASETELQARLNNGPFFPPADMQEYVSDIAIRTLDIDKTHRSDINGAVFQNFLTDHGYGFIYDSSDAPEDKRPGESEPPLADENDAPPFRDDADANDAARVCAHGLAAWDVAGETGVVLESLLMDAITERTERARRKAREAANG